MSDSVVAVGFIPLRGVRAALAACSGMSSRGNRSLLEAIASPTVRENIMHGRLRGYYFNTFLLAAEQGGCVLGQARWVTPCSPRSRQHLAGLAQWVQNPLNPHAVTVLQSQAELI